MKELTTHHFTWFLEDESLLPVVRGITHPDGHRRSYGVHEIEGRRVFIKTFSEKGAAGRIRSVISPRGRKEFFIARELHALGVPAPVPLGYGTGNRVSAIAESCIDGSTLLEAMKAQETRDDLLVRLAQFLLLLKSKGVRHDDLHLDNIFLSHDTLFLIDLHKVRLKKSFSEKDEVTNLKHALGTIYHDMTPREREVFFAAYGGGVIRGRAVDAIEALRSAWITNKMNRAFRDTSVVHRQGTHLMIRGFEEAAHGYYVETIKSDKKVKVERFSDHVRKTYGGRKRFMTAWQNHVVLEYTRKGLTPVVYLAVMPVLGNKGYIAMEDLKDTGEELDRYLDRNYDVMDPRQRRAFISTLARFFLGAMMWSITHRDMKACNVFVKNDGGFLFLDVEDFEFVRATPDILKRTLSQLNNTIPKRISVRDRMRFFLGLVEIVDVDKKAFFKDVLTECLKGEIVYEGASGLVTDKW